MQQCPGGVSQCQTFTFPCGSNTCTVVAGPTTNVGNGEYVYLSMSNFPTTDSVRVAYCPITNPPTIVSGGDPQCAYGLDPDQVNMVPINVPVTPNGTVSASYPTQYAASGPGNATIPADPIISENVPKTPFYCDNGPDYCGIEVQDLPDGDASTPESATNTVIIPITFAQTGSGCPSSDPLINTDSAFSLEHFLPAAVDSTCTQSSGVSDLNTATDTDQVVQDLASGGVQVSFTDEPQNVAEQADLSGTSVEYVPIAVSATVVGFLGGDVNASDEQPFPVSTYELTPNMVAGLISSGYAEGYGSDLVMPPLVCSDIYECGTKSGDTTTADNYDTFDLLNPVPAGVNGPAEFGMFFSSTASGASYQVTDWLCNAPNTPITVTVPIKKGNKGVPTPELVTDPNVASTTLTNPPAAGIAWPPANDPTASWPYTTCSTPYSTLPVLAASSAQYSFDSTPELQAYRIRSFAFQGGASPPQGDLHTSFGFGAMDWSEASYLGLNSASIQNAAGDFVQPSEQSIDAALLDATTSSDGVLQYNYGNSNDAAAYPMPLVTYAIVPTAAQSPADSQAEGDLLTNLVCYSSNGGSIPLPSGYVPLPSTLYNKAISEIDTALPYTEKGCNGANPTLPTSSTGSGKSTGTGSQKGSGTSSTSTGTSSTPTGTNTNPTGTNTNPNGSGVATTGHSTGTATTTPSVTKPSSSSPQHVPGPKGPGRGFQPVILALAEGTERWIVAGLGGAALLGLIVGPLIVLAPRARRRLRKAPVQT